MTTRGKLHQCQVEGCGNLAKYALFRTKPDGKKEWLHVCRYHERVIGNENMRRAGGRYKGGETNVREQNSKENHQAG